MSRPEIDAWHGLSARALEPNPLFEPQCVVAAARHQTFGDQILVAVVEDRGKFFGCVPFRRVNNWYNVRYPIAANKVRRSTYVGTPLIDRDRGKEVAESLLVTFSEHRRSFRYRLLGLDSLRSGPVETLLLDAARSLGFATYVQEDFERGFASRRSDASYLGHTSSKFRWNVRSRRRRLTEHTGHPVVLVDRAGQPRAIEEFIKLESAGYKAHTVALASVPGEPEYFREMCSGFAADKRLNVLSLESGSTILAMLVWLRGDDGLFQIKTTYDERFRAFGPGILLQVEAFDFFHSESGANWIDTCASPGNETFLGLFPETTRIRTVLFSLGGGIEASLVTNLPRIRRVRRRLIDAAQATGKVLSRVQRPHERS